jgi:hypothetical protein
MCLKLFERITKEPTSLQVAILDMENVSLWFHVGPHWIEFSHGQFSGDFTSTLYADDCLFADPTIHFRESYITYTSFPLGNAEDNSPMLVVCSSNAVCAGRDKYQRNLKLLEPKLILFGIQEVVHHFLMSVNINSTPNFFPEIWEHCGLICRGRN